MISLHSILHLTTFVILLKWCHLSKHTLQKTANISPCTAEQKYKTIKHSCILYHFARLAWCRHLNTFLWKTYKLMDGWRKSKWKVISKRIWKSEDYLHGLFLTVMPYEQQGIRITGNSTVLNCWFGLTTKKHQSSKSLAVCEGNLLVIGEFPRRRARNTASISILWRYHDFDPSIM